MFLIGSDVPGQFGIGFNLMNLVPSVEIVKGGFLAPKPIKPNQWFHMAAVFGENHTTLYIDGKPVAKGPASKLCNDTKFVIGNVGEKHLSQFFNGQIRSVRISKGERYSTDFEPDAVLQSDEMTELIYDASSVRGNKIVDLSSNKNHGTVERLKIHAVTQPSGTTKKNNE